MMSCDHKEFNMNAIFDEHVPLKHVNKYKLKFKSKPWITPAIQECISVKNNLLKRFINSSPSNSSISIKAKEIFQEQWKYFRSILFTLYLQIIITNILKLI